MQPRTNPSISDPSTTTKPTLNPTIIKAPTVSTGPTHLHLFDAATHTKPPDRTLLMPFSQLVEELTNFPKQQVDLNTGYAMTIAQLTVDMPIELKVTVNHDGKVNLKGSPPTQLVKTTIMPVFHQMRLTVVREDGDE